MNLVNVYQKQCRSIIELAVPASGLTENDIHPIETVKKTDFEIILGDLYSCLQHSLNNYHYPSSLVQNFLMTDRLTKEWTCKLSSVTELKKVILCQWRWQPIPYLTWHFFITSKEDLFICWKELKKSKALICT